jgi:P pilus assembly chaperone PapD
MKSEIVPLLALLGFVLFSAVAGHAQTAGLGINPGRSEIEMKPGQEKTVAFEIEAPPSDVVMRGRLMLSLADWDIKEDAGIAYSDPATHSNSAASWIVFSPAAVNIASGQKQLVRVTVRLPQSAQPGVYRAAIFVQERPPATPPDSGQHLVYVRFRYVFFLYVVVPPVSIQAELLDVALQIQPGGANLVCSLRNGGSRHARPYISWTIRDANQQVIRSVKQYEASVLLPFSSLNERFPIDETLPPGKYEVTAQVDFQDKGPLHSLTRTVHVGGALESADAAER